MRLELTTLYAPDERLEMWVPGEFREHYEYGVMPKSLDTQSEYEDIICHAKYTNFRRFETSVRIK
jgi:hypothetical protein